MRIWYIIYARVLAVWDKIIPFFNKYPVEGVKALNFSDFVAIASLMRDKAHLTPEGYKQILFIKNRMNKSR
jgi:hypothetical protein